MKRSLAALVFIAFSGLAFNTSAMTKTVTLSVPGMTCPVCPITVKKALMKVNGVSGVVVNYDKKQTVGTFDDVKTTAEALTRATIKAGYPSTLAGSRK
jgi:mercuric ion binding protein